MPGLFDPLKLGPLTLPNRIWMAPLTRSRAGPERQPNALMAEYYAQRASAGLILSEATSVTPMSINIVMFRNKWPLGTIRRGYTHPFHPIPAICLFVLCAIDRKSVV